MKDNQWVEECSICGKKAQVADCYTPFGCNYTGYGPEPLDEEYVCVNCWDKFYKEWIESLQQEHTRGDWQKSRAEICAAKVLNLVWVGSGGLGILGSKQLWEEPHRYISTSRWEQLKDLPYYGYCRICGSIVKGGHCTKKGCENGFKAMHKALYKTLEQLPEKVSEEENLPF